MKQNTVLGLGNILNRDEGVGVHALREMERNRRSGSSEVVFVDGGTLGLDLLPIVESSRNLLVLDAVDWGEKEGLLVEIPGERIPLYSTLKLSFHQTTFQEVLGLAKARGRFPHDMTLLGIQVGNLSIGLDLSRTVEGSLPTLVRRAWEIIGRWT